MTPVLIALIAASVFITALISGTFGMAGGMIMMAVLLQLLPIASAIFLHAAIQLVSNGWRCWLWRRHIVWRVLPVYGAGMLTGLVFVISLKYVPDTATVLIMIGAVPLLALAVRRIVTLTIYNPAHSFVTAVALTFIHMTGGVIGALLDLLYNNTGLTRHQIVATKAFTQGSSHLMRLAYFGALVPLLTGQGQWPEEIGLPVFALFLAVSIAGTSSAALILHRLSDDTFKRISRYIVAAISVYCLCCGFYMLYIS